MDPLTLMMGSSAIGGIGSLVGGFLGSNAATNAAQIQANAEEQALNFQQGVFSNVSGQLQPYISGGLGDISSARTALGGLSPYAGMGTNALGTINQLYGYSPAGGGGTGKPDFSAFTNSPDYQFAFQQGQAATTNALNASGQGGMSGGGLAALTQYGQGMATQQFGNYFNRLMQMAGTGLTAGTAQAAGFSGLGGLGAGVAGSLAGFGSNMSNTIGNTIGGIGTAQASGIVGSTNALTGGITGVANAANAGVNNYLGYNMFTQQQQNNALLQQALLGRMNGSSYSPPPTPSGPSMPAWMSNASYGYNVGQ